MALTEEAAPVRFVWTTNGRVRRVVEPDPVTPERLELISRLLERASEAFNRKAPEDAAR